MIWPFSPCGNCAWIPGSVRMPVVGALFWQLAGVKAPVVALNVGQVPVEAVRMSVNGCPPTTTDAA